MVEAPQMLMAGGLLASGSILVDHLANLRSAELNGQGHVLAQDSAPIIFKIETMDLGASQRELNTTTVISWAIFGCLMILALFPMWMFF